MSSQKTFVVGDTHFGHESIIDYCERPFKSVAEMNRTIVNNWNDAVRKKDKVYFLGDLCLDHDRRQYWLRILNGDITQIRGNHDPCDAGVQHLIIRYSDRDYLLVHDPASIDSVPLDWHGWIIHGHHHNYFPETYPFLNGPAQTFNVSLEHTKYRPVDMETIHRLAQEVECVNPDLFLLNVRA